ncbi:MAG TPA: YlxR family protein [Nocardioidaceae bacterium]|nr:YlxR family protein [Nocardioidaceae bacterium]
MSFTPVPSRSTAGHEGSVRTCVGCRQRATKSELLRVVAGDRGAGLEVVPDPAGRAPGRGAHLHPTSACLELALRRRAFARALKTEGPGGRLATTAVEDFVAQQQ